jgi:hypothetical protein
MAIKIHATAESYLATGNSATNGILLTSHSELSQKPGPPFCVTVESLWQLKTEENKPMDILLDTIEVRVLGSLLEKELATPEYYPLSLNALVNACNQKINRFPALMLDEETVVRALQSLKKKRLVGQSDTSRVPKYWHDFIRQNNLIRREAALLCL